MCQEHHPLTSAEWSGYRVGSQAGLDWGLRPTVSSSAWGAVWGAGAAVQAPRWVPMSQERCARPSEGLPRLSLRVCDPGAGPTLRRPSGGQQMHTAARRHMSRGRCRSGTRSRSLTPSSPTPHPRPHLWAAPGSSVLRASHWPLAGAGPLRQGQWVAGVWLWERPSPVPVLGGQWGAPLRNCCLHPGVSRTANP